MPKLNFIPIAGTKNKVFVEPVKLQEKKSVGGLLTNNAEWEIQNKEQKWEKYGKVLAISERDENGVLPNVKIDDIVYFDGLFNEQYFDDILCLVMRETNIYAKQK